jgi:hypothetical protein
MVKMMVMEWCRWTVSTKAGWVCSARGRVLAIAQPWSGRWRWEKLRLDQIDNIVFASTLTLKHENLISATASRSHVRGRMLFPPMCDANCVSMDRGMTAWLCMS